MHDCGNDMVVDNTIELLVHKKINKFILELFAMQHRMSVVIMPFIPLEIYQ